jgi:hypothetical protein
VAIDLLYQTTILKAAVPPYRTKKKIIWISLRKRIMHNSGANLLNVERKNYSKRVVSMLITS